MIARLLGAMGIVLLGGALAAPSLMILSASTQPIGAVCETVRIGAPLLTLAAAGLFLLFPLFARWWGGRMFSGWRAGLMVSVMAAALPLLALGLVASGVLFSNDPFAGQALPLANARLTTNMAQPLDLRFQGQVGQVFRIDQKHEILWTASANACSRNPETVIQHFLQTVEQTIERVATSGTLTIRQQWPKAEITRIRNGQVEFHFDSAMPGADGERSDLLAVTLRAEQFPTGGLRVLAVEGEGTGVERVRSIMEWAESQDASMLPEAAVRPGDRWRLGQRRLELPRNGTLTYISEATLAGLTLLDGREIAIINTVARDVAFAADLDRQSAIEVKRFAVKGRIAWDVARGRPLTEMTLIDFVGQGHSPGYSPFLLHIQASLRTVEDP